jgi:hypothetical protein
MNAINILLACLGGGITVLVVVGMFLLTPGGTEVRDPAVSPEPELAAPHADAPRSAPKPTGRIA